MIRNITISFLLCTIWLSLAVAETVAIVGADVHTMSKDGTLRGATLLLTDGKITAMGIDVEIPKNAREIDASDNVITPGLFHSISRLGVLEVGAESSTVDYWQRSGAPFSASFNPALAFNPRSTHIASARSEGISHALIAPSTSSGETSSGGVFAGLGSVIHLGSVTDFSVRGPAAMLARLGAGGGELNDGSRARALQFLRLALDDAKDYANNRAAYNSGARREYSVSASDLESLQPVLAARIPLIVEANRESDLRQLIDLATTYDLRLIVLGAGEAWRVASELAAADIAVIIQPMQNLPDDFDRLDASLENAARLHRAGVRFAITELNSYRAGNLRQGAGNAVAHGLPWIAGLNAITHAPAAMLGLDAAVGTLRVGQPATLVVWDGDPLETTTYPKAVWIDGQEVDTTSRQKLLRDRYHPSKTQTPLPPAYR